GKVKGDGSDFFSRSLEELTSPFEGLLSAREASSSFRNDGQLELLNHFLERSQKQREPNWRAAQSLVANFELGQGVSLSWYLSRKEKRTMRSEDVWNDAKTVNYDATVDSLFDWWRAESEVPEVRREPPHP